MKNFITLIASILLLSSSLWAQEEDISFSHLFVGVTAGEIYPWSQLQDAVENSAYGGVEVRYTYWEDFDGFVSMNYAYFKPALDNDLIDGVHQVDGMLGLSYHASWLRSVELGGGFICSWTKADYDESKVNRKTFKREPGGTLVDNETEFGWFFRLNLPVWNLDNYRVGLHAMWQELWTLPERSDMMSFGVYFERRIW